MSLYLEELYQSMHCNFLITGIDLPQSSPIVCRLLEANRSSIFPKEHSLEFLLS